MIVTSVQWQYQGERWPEQSGLYLVAIEGYRRRKIGMARYKDSGVFERLPYGYHVHYWAEVPNPWDRENVTGHVFDIEMRRERW